MSRKFFGLMAVAGMAVATGLGGASQDANAGLFGRMFGGHRGGDCGGYDSCGYDGCGYVGHHGRGGYEYDDDDACGYQHRGHRHGYNGCGYGHHNSGCYSSCGPVYSAPVEYHAPVSSCGSCSMSTCNSAPVSHCASSCGHTSHCGQTSHCGSSCGGYATSTSYGGCSSCGTSSYGGQVMSGGCPGGNCGVTYGTPVDGGYSASPMPMESAPAPPQGEEAPAPPEENGSAPVEEPAA